MNQLNSFKDFSFDKNEGKEENQKNNEIKNKIDKVLCDYCGRTKSNGKRCLGICVADNEY
tara:strand:- start:116 stop:295 length:180 start_codon:yes stop_codon:yes gene_type:complete